MNNPFKTGWMGVRARLLMRFMPGYVRWSIASRKGSCRACGKCCMWGNPLCFHLTPDGKCKIYGQAKHCLIFPIDAKEQELAGVKGVCGYYWENDLDEEQTQLELQTR